jgi:DNA-binding CsgD family transcriptional regulator
LQHSKSLRIIICASKGLAALNDHWREADVSPFLFGFKTYYISGMSDEDAELLISQRGQVQASAAVVAAIHKLTGNHPFLLQTLCDRLYQHGTLREPRPQDSMVEPMMADLFRIDVAYLSPGEQHILFTLARHGPLESSAVQQYTGLPIAVLQNFLHGMARLGYVRTDGAGVWSVGNEFLAQWLRLYPVQTDSAITDQASLEVVGAEPAELASSTVPVLDEPLSEREDEVLQLLARGRRNPEIARALMISENTVKAHLKSIYRKLGVGDRVRAVNRARELGLV